MEAIFGRHGQLKERQRGITVGQMPGTLTFRGERQHSLVAEYLADTKLDAIYCSDLHRAGHLAFEVSQRHPGVPMYPRMELREGSRGIFQGRPSREAERYARERGMHYHRVAWPGGDSWETLEQRTVGVMREIVETHPDGRVFIAGHGGATAAILLKLLNRPFEEFAQFHLSYGGLTIVRISPDFRGEMVERNYTNHLRVLSESDDE